MKITHLHLSRYGHLTDVNLAFDPQAGLQIVLGANEAGKSTALAAIGDALFNFPARTTFDFLHASKDLRIGIGLRGADGQEQFFVRRKGRKDTLLDAGENPIPEVSIGQFLGGASRERFAEFFGMDGATLRRGGAAILEGRGEVGQSIALAFSRRHDVRGALTRLNDQALELYGARRGDKAFHVAADNFKRARQDLDDRSIRPADYDRTVKEREACETARAKNAAERAQLEAERAKLDRIRRTTPARLALQRHQSDLAALGETRFLAENAEARRAAALQSREIAARTYEREAAAQAENTSALQSLAIDEAILAEAATIDTLAADLNRILGAMTDRQTQELQAENARGRMQTKGAALGLPPDPKMLEARMPNALVRADAQRAINEQAKLADRAERLAADRIRATAAVVAAETALAETPEPQPVPALTDAIEAAKAEGRLDADLAAAEDDHAASQRALATALAALPFWQGTAEALARAPTPLAADIARAEAALAEAAKNLVEKRRTNAAHLETLKSIAADLAGFLAAGAPPTRDAVDAARSRRDLAWHLIRRHSIEGGPPPTEDELNGLPGNLPEAFPALIAEADALADRNFREAERVAAYEQLCVAEARTKILQNAAEQAAAEAETALAAAEAAWLALWQPTGIIPGDPAAMREWGAHRKTALAALAETQRKHATLDRLRGRHDLARNNLAACLPQEATSGVKLAPLLRAAERLRAAHEEAVRRHAENVRTLTQAQRALAEIDSRAAPLAKARSEWHENWVLIAAKIGLMPEASADQGADALAIWADLERDATDWRHARVRIAEMTADIGSFETRVAACLQGCAPHLASKPIQAAVRTLAETLGATRAAAAKRTELVQKIAARGQHLKALESEIASAEDELLALRSLAGVETNEALAIAIQRATEAADLSGKIATRKVELDNLADGLTTEQLALEAEAIETENLPARIAEIDHRLRAISDENEMLVQTLRDLKKSLDDMEKGKDAAEAAQRMQDEAAAAEAAAARYIKLRLAHTLLRAGIDRFRREQQAPLLEAAGTLFAALTENRYRRLALDEEEDGKMIVIAERPDGAHCPADRLSEGTRDQLFLALRLAAIKTQAGHTELLPFIADDLLASFDDARARAALRMLADFGETTQTILFTHHAHIAAMAADVGAPVYGLEKNVLF